MYGNRSSHTKSTVGYINTFQIETDILLCFNTETAFLQIRIRESQRDALRFHWISNLNLSRIEVIRFTRLVFGLMQSSFILEVTLKEHFDNYKSVYPELIENMRNDISVDALVSWGNTLSQVEVIKQKSIELFAKDRFNLHKWHSNVSLLEKSGITNNDELTYDKQLFLIVRVIPKSQAYAGIKLLTHCLSSFQHISEKQLQNVIS